MGDSDGSRSRLVRTGRDLLAWIAFWIAAAAIAARFVPVINHALLFTAAFAPQLTMFALASALLLVYNKRRAAAIVAFALFAVGVAVQMPRFIGSSVHPDHRVAVRVLTTNVFEGRADPKAVAEAARSRADLLLVQELNNDFVKSLRPLDADFPYRAVDTDRSGRDGVGIWSRYPLVQTSRISRYKQRMITATVRVPGAAAPAVLASVHLAGPWPQPIDDWRREIAALPDTLSDVARAAGRGAVIVAGDFNATIDMQPFRKVLDAGFADVVAQDGGGLKPTFPSHSWVPPLIGIDHILTHDSSATGVQTFRLPGSDHLAMTATIHLPG